MTAWTTRRPGSLQPQIERLLPLEVGSVMINNSAPDAFGPWAGFLILCGYTVLGEQLAAACSPAWHLVCQGT